MCQLAFTYAQSSINMKVFYGVFAFSMAIFAVFGAFKLYDAARGCLTANTEVEVDFSNHCI